MQFLKLALTFALLVAVTCAVKVRFADPKRAVENKFISVYIDGITQDQRETHIRDLLASFQTDPFDNQIHQVYQIGRFNAFSASLSAKALAYLEQSDLISSIEQDAQVSAIQIDACSTQTGATWGIDRIAEQSINLDGIFNYSTVAGGETDSYIVDTGILLDHNDFGGRAIWGANFADSINTDCNGHGTHVAGTVGGTVYGIAKQTTLIAVKVLGCSGSGTWEGVISGIEWVATSAASRKRPSVANMSLGGGFMEAVNAAVTGAVEAGVTFVVAAGNENTDACSRSPASAKLAVTVGATGIDALDNNQVDNRAYFSNYGTCVDIFAPGLQITSDWITSPSSINTISGTSMASPHIAGMSAAYLATNTGATPQDVENWLLSSATRGILQLDCFNSACLASPNVFAYCPCLA